MPTPNQPAVICSSCRKMCYRPATMIPLNLNFRICEKCWAEVPAVDRIRLQHLFTIKAEGGLGLKELIEEVTRLVIQARREGESGEWGLFGSRN